MSRRPLHRNQILGITQTRNVQRFNSAICGETVIHILRNHVLVNQKVDTAIPAYLFVSSKCRSHSSSELHAGLNERFHGKYLAGARSFHIGSSPPEDLPILDDRLERIMRPA